MDMKMQVEPEELLTGEPNSWNSRHWVFRRAGKECWICKTRD